MKYHNPFLGETTDRDQAFPGIRSLELTIVQDPCGYYTRQSSARESRFTKTTLPPYFACANPRCQQGGLDLQQIVLSWPPGKHTFYCNGHEGTPKGRRVGVPCCNSFEITLNIQSAGQETQ